MGILEERRQTVERKDWKSDLSQISQQVLEVRGRHIKQASEIIVLVEGREVRVPVQDQIFVVNNPGTEDEFISTKFVPRQALGELTGNTEI